MQRYAEFVRELFDSTAALSWYAEGQLLKDRVIPVREHVFARFALGDIRYRVSFHAFRLEQVSETEGLTREITTEVVFAWDDKSPFAKFNLSIGDKYSLINANLKHEFRVFAAVRDAISTYLTRYRPALMFFTAEDDEPSRVRLYDTFVKKGSGVFSGYRMSKTRYHYEIRRNDLLNTKITL